MNNWKWEIILDSTRIRTCYCMENESPRRNRNFCKSRRIGVAIFTTECIEFTDQSTGEKEFNKFQELFKPMLLTDCCSLFSIILSMRPNSQGRCSRIIMAHLRYFQSFLSISHADASVNLGDVCPKHGGGWGGGGYFARIRENWPIYYFTRREKSP